MSDVRAAPREPELPAGARVLVTGASGFIGRALCRRLAAQGMQVLALGRRRAAGPWQEFHEADVGESLPEAAFAGVRAVFHLAAWVHAVAERRADEAYCQRVNVAGTASVVRAACAAGVDAFVLASSVKAMGEGSEQALDETAAPRPQTAYGRSKLAAEGIVLAASRGGMRASAVRLPLIYGPGAGGNLGRLLRAIARRRLPALAFPRNARSMLDVRDAAEAMVLCASRPAAAGQVYLVTDGEDYSMQRVERAMRQALGLPEPRLRMPAAVLGPLARAGDVLGTLAGRRMPFDSRALAALAGSARYDGAKARRELGFEPRWNLERALPAMVACLRKESAPG